MLNGKTALVTGGARGIGAAICKKLASLGADIAIVDLTVTEQDQAYLEARLADIMDRLPQIDEQLSEKIEGWKLSRVGKVELALLRIAVYEILYDDEVPTGVAISEAVELSKKYGPDNAASFVNGVLAKFA